MKRILVVLLAAAALSAAAVADPAPPPRPAAPLDDLAKASVTIDAGDGSGSGVVFKNKAVSFVWTDAHVVVGCRKSRREVDPKTGVARLVLQYKDVWVVREEVEAGRKVGETRHLARIVRLDDEQDIALLYVHKQNYGERSVRFLDGVPAVGSALWHVGSFHGGMGPGSVSDGVVSAVGRLRRDYDATDTDAPFVYDQMSAIAHHGSSGGGVFLKDTGECIGLVTEFLSVHQGRIFTHGSFCITPARRLREWAADNKVTFALDDRVAVPPMKTILEGLPAVAPAPAGE